MSSLQDNSPDSPDSPGTPRTPQTGHTGAAFVRSTELIAGVTKLQRREPDPSPAELAGIAAATSRHLATLTGLATVLHGQVARLDQHRVLRCDDRTDPATVLHRVSADVAALRAALANAETFAVSLANDLNHLTGSTPGRI